jgi:hypothetical protein
MVMDAFSFFRRLGDDDVFKIGPAMPFAESLHPIYKISELPFRIGFGCFFIGIRQRYEKIFLGEIRIHQPGQILDCIPVVEILLFLPDRIHARGPVWRRPFVRGVVPDDFEVLPGIYPFFNVRHSIPPNLKLLAKFWSEKKFCFFYRPSVATCDERKIAIRSVVNYFNVFKNRIGEKLRRFTRN